MPDQIRRTSVDSFLMELGELTGDGDFTVSKELTKLLEEFQEPVG